MVLDSLRYWMVSGPAEWCCHSSQEPEAEHRVLLASGDTRCPTQRCSRTGKVVKDRLRPLVLCAAKGRAGLTLLSSASCNQHRIPE